MRHELPGFIRLEAPDAWTWAASDDPRVALLLLLPEERGICEVLRLPQESPLDPGEVLRALLVRAPSAPPSPLVLPAGWPAAIARVDHPPPEEASQLAACVVGPGCAVVVSLTGEPAAISALEPDLRVIATSIELLERPSAGRLEAEAAAALAARWPDHAFEPVCALLLRVRAPDGSAGEVSLVDLAETGARPDRFAARVPLDELRAQSTARLPLAPSRVLPALLAPETPSALARTLESGLRVTLVDDTRVSRRELDLVDLLEQGWSWEQAFARACTNLEAHLSRYPHEGSEGSDGRPAFLAISGTPHAAAALVLHSFTGLGGLLGAPFLACAPARDALLAWRADDREVDGHARATAGRLHRESRAPLPMTVWRVEEGGLRRAGRLL